MSTVRACNFFTANFLGVLQSQVACYGCAGLRVFFPFPKIYKEQFDYMVQLKVG